MGFHDGHGSVTTGIVGFHDGHGSVTTGIMGFHDGLCSVTAGIVGFHEGHGSVTAGTVKTHDGHGQGFLGVFEGAEAVAVSFYTGCGRENDLDGQGGKFTFLRIAPEQSQGVPSGKNQILPADERRNRTLGLARIILGHARTFFRYSASVVPSTHPNLHPPSHD